MRKAAGIILITIGVLSLCGVAIVLRAVVTGNFGLLFVHFPGDLPLRVGLVCLVVPIAVHISGGIFCLRRKYWRVCLASASFGVLFSVLFPVLFQYLWLWINDISSMSWVYWVMLVADEVSVIFIVRTKREWQEIPDSVDGKVSYGG